MGFAVNRECIVVCESAHFARKAPEAFARLVDRLALPIRFSKHDRFGGAPHETPAPVNLQWRKMIAGGLRAL